MLSSRRLKISGLALAALLSSSVSSFADDEPNPSSLTPCPYTQAELEANLGVRVEAGIASDMQGPGQRDVGCVYPVADSFLAIAVRQTWDPNGSLEEPSSSRVGLRRIVGDGDQAVWKKSKDKNDDHRLKLKYRRGKVSTTVEVYGSFFRDEDMQPGLLKLKRVP